MPWLYRIVVRATAKTDLLIAIQFDSAQFDKYLTGGAMRNART